MQILGAWIWVVGCIIQAAANNVTTLVAGRVVGGLSVGILSAIVTTYQAELTKPSIRFVKRFFSCSTLVETYGLTTQGLI